MSQITTAGHGTMAPSRFFRLLVSNGTGTAADIRAPDPQHGEETAGTASPSADPAYTPGALAEAFRRLQIEYIQVGGGMSGGPGLKSSYGAIARSDEFRQTVRLLEQAATDSRLTLICACSDPAECYRSLLIGQALYEQGHKIVHLTPEGDTEHRELLDRLQARHNNTTAAEALIQQEINIIAAGARQLR